MLRNTAINLSLKIGLAIPFMYTCLASFFVPDHVLSFWPKFIVRHINETVILFITGLGTLIFVVSMLFFRSSDHQKFVVSSSGMIAIALVGLSNLDNVPFLIDLVPLFFIALALTLRYYPRVRVVAETKITPLANVTIQKHKYAEVKDTVVEVGIDAEHDQHIFVPKQ